MNKRGIRIWFVRLVTAILVVVASAPLATRAATVDDSLSLSETPPVRELNVQAGQTLDESLDITNQAKGDVTLYPLVRDVTSSDDPNSSSPKVIEDSSVVTPTGLFQWVSFATESVVISAGQTVSLGYTIHVPADAEPGGHYGAVFVTSQKPSVNATPGVGIQTRIGSLLLITVGGKTTVSVDPVGFSAVDGNGKPQQLFQQLPVHFKTTIHNTGNIHVQPTGVIDIKNSFGTQVLKMSFNEADGRVLPNSTRVFTNDLASSIGWGKFTATETLTIRAADGTTLPMTATTTFWLVPIMQSIWVIAILFLIILVFKMWLMRHDQLLELRDERRSEQSMKK